MLFPWSLTPAGHSVWRVYRRGLIIGLAALAVVAVVLAVSALNRDSSLTTAVAVVPPSFPPAVSASSAPLASSTPTPSPTPTPTITPPVSSPPPKPAVAFLGDTYTAGDGASSTALRWTSLVAADYGWAEKNFGLANSGYSTGGTAGGAAPYTARIAALAATAPSIVIVAGGRYDIQTSNGPTKIKTGITATFTALRAALPHAQIIAESPLWAPGKAPATLSLVAADVKAAVTAVGGRYLDVGQPLIGVPTDIGTGAIPNDAGYAALAKAFETAYGK